MVECLHAVYATTEFLELFFENLLMNAGHELKNRYMLLSLHHGFHRNSSYNPGIFGNKGANIQLRF